MGTHRETRGHAKTGECWGRLETRTYRDRDIQGQGHSTSSPKKQVSLPVQRAAHLVTTH